MVGKKLILVIAVVAAVAGAVVALVFSGDNQKTPSQSSGSSKLSQPAPSSKTLDYSDRGLTQFPKEILGMTSATSLNLSHNGLSGALPAEIKNLASLQTLDVSYNNMTGIPAEIGQMHNLKVINYSYNNITGLPNELGNLTGLQVLDLRGNNPSSQDLAGIRSKLPNTEIKL